MPTPEAGVPTGSDLDPDREILPQLVEQALRLGHCPAWERWSRQAAATIAELEAADPSPRMREELAVLADAYRETEALLRELLERVRRER